MRAWIQGRASKVSWRKWLTGVGGLVALVFAFFSGTILPWDQQGWEALQHVQYGFDTVGLTLFDVDAKQSEQKYASSSEPAEDVARNSDKQVRAIARCITGHGRRSDHIIPPIPQPLGGPASEEDFGAAADRVLWFKTGIHVRCRGPRREPCDPDGPVVPTAGVMTV
jgi:hypothetical protein